MDIPQAKRFINSPEAPLSDRLEAVEVINREETDSGRFIAISEVPLHERDNVTFGDPNLVDQIDWRMVVGVAAVILMIVAIVAIALIPSDTAAPVLEWIQRWLP